MMYNENVNDSINDSVIDWKPKISSISSNLVIPGKLKETTDLLLKGPMSWSTLDVFKTKNTRPKPTAKPASDWRHLFPHLQQIAEDENCDITKFAQQFHARKRPIVTKIIHAFKTTRNPQDLMHILVLLDEKGFVEKNPYLRAIAGIADHYPERLREMETFCFSNTQSTRKQFSLLIRHLYANYEIPLFMDSVWSKGNSLHQEWFLHLGSGKNLRTANGLPIQVTKKIAHYFGESPSHFTVEEALRWGQAYAVGGKKLAQAICRTRLVHTFTNTDDDAFWVNFLRFLNPHLSKLSQRDINRLVEYIYDSRFVGEQRHFRIKGKCLQTLLADAESWEKSQHEDTEDRVVGFEFSPSEQIAPSFQFQCAEQGWWSIKQLLSSSALVREGKNMEHCVGEIEYANACRAGESTIWSLRCDHGTGTENLLTIEVDVEENNITEMRGKRNRVATAKERGTVRIWAFINKITDTGNLLG